MTTCLSAAELLDRVTDPVPDLLDRAEELTEACREWRADDELSRFVEGNLNELADVLSDLRRHVKGRCRCG